MPWPTAYAVVLNHIDRVSRGNVDMQTSWINEERSLYCWKCRTRLILPNVGTYLQDFYSIPDLNIFCMEHAHRASEAVYVPTTDTVEVMAEDNGRRLKDTVMGFWTVANPEVAIPEKTCYVDDIVPTHTERRIKDDD